MSKPGRLRRSACLVGLAYVASACTTDNGSQEAFCARVVEVPIVTSAEQLQGREGVAMLARLSSALDRLAKASPPDIRPQVATMSTVAKQIRAANNATGTTTSTTKSTDQADLDRFADASDRVVTYAKRTCGVELDQRR